MIGQQGVEVGVEFMPAFAGYLSCRRIGPVAASGWVTSVKDFPIDRNRPCLRQCLLISTGQAGPSGASAQRMCRAGH